MALSRLEVGGQNNAEALPKARQLQCKPLCQPIQPIEGIDLEMALDSEHG